MAHPQMIACGLSLPHKARMGITGMKYGRKIMKHMKGTGAYKKDYMMGGAMQPAVMKPAVMPRPLKFR